jgi:prophage regulatory protein
MQQNQIPATGFVRLPQILAVFPISKSSWWAGMKSGKYPASVKLGGRTTAWRAEDIKQLLETVSKNGGV